MKRSALIFILFSSNLLASDNYITLKDQVIDIEKSLDQSLKLIHHSFEMNKIRVRTRLEFGISIPLIADFKIKPEIELFFTK